MFKKRCSTKEKDSKKENVNSWETKEREREKEEKTEKETKNRKQITPTSTPFNFFHAFVTSLLKPFTWVVSPR